MNGTPRIVFRTDASVQIGTGHVMRCLTLADALRARGVDCQFICREHPGNLIDFIRGKGYPTQALPAEEHVVTPLPVSNDMPGQAHTSWLGVSQSQDASECAAILGNRRVNWLVVDHYALDARWEHALKPYFDKLLVIDDLADRSHCCDLLVDQTFGRGVSDYRALVSATCTLLCGSQHALLKPEFAALRAYSLERRRAGRAQHLLITMGGVDKDNVTERILHALKGSALPADCRITVVMGNTAPWLVEVRLAAETMPWPTTVEVGITNMAQLMADSDLAIGAAGATSWERCCLGLPTVLVVLATNQSKVARGLEQVGAARVLSDAHEIEADLPRQLNGLLGSPAQRAAMSRAAAAVVDGAGVTSVLRQLEL